jgi:serine/threonine-protein kinase
MGEVYRATDSKLKRDVAIKVLPEGFAQDPERLARFEREAQVLASLNHPNIASIYGLEESDGRSCLILELIEGQGLDEMVAGGSMPVEKVLPLALQIAEALEAAHEKGIVHRDLKPANIKVTPDGTVKVLDFGLAKAFSDDSGQGASDLSLSPTLTAMATQAGVIIGTAAYMSPEQAAGQAADRRADVWSFGVVVVEMLTGGKPFGGETVSHTLASVLKEEPRWEQLPADLPPRLTDLLRSCLRKKPRERLQAIGDARRLLEEYLADPEAFAVQAQPAAGAQVQAAAASRLPWAAVAVLALALVGMLWALWPAHTPPAEPTRLTLPAGEGEALMRGYGSGLVLNADGTQLAYVAFMPGGDRSLILRSLDQWESTVLVGEGGPYHPFFSPDGEWVGYVTRTELKKVPTRGGSSITLCPLALNRGATWTEDGMILFAPNPSSGLSQVPASGGDPEPLTELDEAREEISHRWPQVLPGDQQVLFTVRGGSEDSFDQARIELLDRRSGERKVIHEGGSYARYVNSGHIVYTNRGTLFAFPFDLAAGEATGSAAPVVEGVSSDPNQGGAQFSVSADGILAYAEGSAERPGTTMVWVDREGNFQPLWDESQLYQEPSVAPDGTRVAVSISVEGNGDIWVYDLERDVPTRLTFNDGWEWSPVWSPDSQWIYFAVQWDAGHGIYRVPSDGSGDPEPVLESKNIPNEPTSVSPDGSRLLLNARVPGATNIHVLDLEDGGSEPMIESAFINAGGKFSPDGRWIVYGSNESGRFEVYVRPADGSRGRWQISDVGSYPLWSGDGKTIYYRNVSTDETFAVEVEAQGSALRAGRPQLLFDGPFQATADGRNRYSVDRTRERFLMLHEPDRQIQGHEHLKLVLNWFTDLDRTFGSSGRR